MAYRGLLKPKYWWLKSRPFLWIGFLCGFGLGGTVTHQVYRFNNSGYYTWSRKVNDTGYYVWQALAFPASLIRSVPNATEVTPSALSFVLLTNGTLVGSIGALIAWLIEKRAKRKAIRIVEVQETATKEQPKAVHVGATIAKTTLRGFVLGSGGSILLHGIGYVMGYYAMWLFWWPLFMPTAALCRIVGYTWPAYADPTFSQRLTHAVAVSLINGFVVGILCGLGKTVRELTKK